MREQQQLLLDNTNLGKREGRHTREEMCVARISKMMSGRRRDIIYTSYIAKIECCHKSQFCNAAMRSGHSSSRCVEEQFKAGVPCNWKVQQRSCQPA